MTKTILFYEQHNPERLEGIQTLLPPGTTILRSTYLDDNFDLENAAPNVKNVIQMLGQADIYVIGFTHFFENFILSRVKDLNIDAELKDIAWLRGQYPDTKIVAMNYPENWGKLMAAGVDACTNYAVVYNGNLQPLVDTLKPYLAKKE